MDQIDKSRRSRLTALLLSALFVLPASSSCSDEDAADANSTKDCEAKTCASNAPAIAWSAKDPQFFAQLRVVDALGEPVSGASLTVGAESGKSDADGRASIGPVSAKQHARMRVEKSGHTPVIATSTAWKSGKSTQEVGLVPIGAEKPFKGEAGVKISDGGGSAEIKSRSLATPDGVRAAEGKAEATYFPPSKDSGASMPGSHAAIDKKGAPTALRDLGGVLYLHFSDASGKPLNLAQGQSAALSFPVKGAQRKSGDSLPLWSLDEKSAEWKQESSCVVTKRKVGNETQLVCTGSVSHFSYWAVAEELDLSKVGSLGCVNTATSVAKDACFKAEVQSQTLYACDDMGENCTESGPVREAFLPATDEAPSWCGVIDAAATYRVQLVYDVDAAGCSALSKPPKSGRRVMMTAPISLSSFSERIGSDLMLDFTQKAGAVCADECKQVPFEIKLSDLEAPTWTDADDDGFFRSSADDSELAPGVPADCDDEDAATHPFAAEPYCVSEDRNCDGKTNKVKSYADVADPEAWNATCGVCSMLKDSAIKLGAEMAGNLYDEDCDGVVEDRDGDGSSAPEDCDDDDAASSPGATEIEGNFADENCDGIALDADGDGLFAREQIDAADRLGLSPGKFSDCDDFDARANPGVKPADEAGALRDFFYEAGESVRRRVDYCNLFDEMGKPSEIYYQVVKDLSCDGIVTDADGDGFAAVGDNTLGAALAIDCDDLDPRVAPARSEDRTCMADANLANDSSCEVDVPRGAAACPALTLSGTVLATVCEETTDPTDGSPTGAGACTYTGWAGGNPLSVEPGTLWGPCDGGPGAGVLADCPGESSCNGQLSYTASFTKYLEDTYLEGKPLGYRGMCFPVCAIP